MPLALTPAGFAARRSCSIRFFPPSASVCRSGSLRGIPCSPPRSRVGCKHPAQSCGGFHAPRAVLQQQGQDESLRYRFEGVRLPSQRCKNIGFCGKPVPIIGKANAKVNIKPERKQVSVKRRDEMFMNPLFLELWNKMKQKTIYRINMDIQHLIEKSVKEISEMPEIRKSRILKEVASFNIKQSGVDYKENASSTSEYEQELPLPDVVRILADSTKLPRNNIAQILLESGRLKDFLNNPEKFIEVVAEIIERNKTERAIDGIKYIKLDGQEYTFYEVFNFDEEKDIIAFEDINAIKVEHSVYDYIIYDSDTVERPFAKALDNDPDVKLFFKIPKTFKISTPLSNYSPDWAVYVETENEKKLYFVIETKGNENINKLRPDERLKIHCGEEHFKALASGIEYNVAKDWQALKRRKV